MAATSCPGKTWTTIPDTGGDMLIRSASGGWVTTDGTTPADLRAAFPLPPGGMVIKAGLVVNFYPASHRGTTVTSMPV